MQLPIIVALWLSIVKDNHASKVHQSMIRVKSHDLKLVNVICVGLIFYQSQGLSSILDLLSGPKEQFHFHLLPLDHHSVKELR